MLYARLLYWCAHDRALESAHAARLGRAFGRRLHINGTAFGCRSRVVTRVQFTGFQLVCAAR
jgi:hypothetical protein